MLNSEIKISRQTRSNFINLLQGMSLEELNQIPDGFNNNLIWNFGHIIVTHQLLCYGLSELKMPIKDELVEGFRKGTKPNVHYSQDFLDELVLISSSSLDQFEKDLQSGLFKEFKPYPTSFNITLESFEDAVKFNTAHETLHLGYAMSLKRAINQ